MLGHDVPSNETSAKREVEDVHDVKFSRFFKKGNIKLDGGKVGKRYMMV